jgi:hypothetical protein
MPLFSIVTHYHGHYYVQVHLRKICGLESNYVALCNTFNCQIPVAAVQLQDFNFLACHMQSFSDKHQNISRKGNLQSVVDGYCIDHVEEK